MAILSLALLVSLSATAFAASGDAVATYSETNIERPLAFF